jgi:hypothetical protein
MTLSVLTLPSNSLPYPTTHTHTHTHTHTCLECNVPTHAGHSSRPSYLWDLQHPLRDACAVLACAAGNVLDVGLLGQLLRGKRGSEGGAECEAYGDICAHILGLGSDLGSSAAPPYEPVRLSQKEPAQGSRHVPATLYIGRCLSSARIWLAGLSCEHALRLPHANTRQQQSRTLMIRHGVSTVAPHRRRQRLVRSRHVWLALLTHECYLAGSTRKPLTRRPAYNPHCSTHLTSYFSMNAWSTFAETSRRGLPRHKMLPVATIRSRHSTTPRV